MRRHLLVFLGALGAVGAFFLLFNKGESDLAENHQRALNLFVDLAQMDTALDTEVLYARNTISNNFDDIARAESGFEILTQRLREDGELFGDHTVLSRDIEKYIEFAQVKMSAVEKFKSTNAIYKNSMAVILETVGLEKQGRNEDLSDRMMAFTLSPSKENRVHAEQVIARLRARGGANGLIAHAQKVLSLHEPLQELTRSILLAKTDGQLDQLRESYLREYKRAEDSAGMYRRLLLLATVLLFGLVMTTAYRLDKAAQEIANANANLESRVELRTRELKMSQETILQQQQILVSSARIMAVGEMAGQIAHEINTPLGAIILTAQMLKKKMERHAPDPIEISAKMDFMLQITDKLSRIINSLRKLAGHGANENLVEADLSELILDTLLICEGRFKKSSVDFSFTNELGDRKRLQCRPNEVAQVLVNLLNNAHDAIRGSDQRWVRLKVSAVGDKAVFSVTDSGPGVDEKYRSRLFMPNFTTKSLDVGTGMGLSLCKKLIDQHGGRIYLDTTKPSTCFVFEIPFEQTAALVKSAVA